MSQNQPSKRYADRPWLVFKGTRYGISGTWLYWELMKAWRFRAEGQEGWTRWNPASSIKPMKG